MHQVPSRVHLSPSDVNSVDKHGCRLSSTSANSQMNENGDDDVFLGTNSYKMSQPSLLSKNPSLGTAPSSRTTSVSKNHNLNYLTDDSDNSMEKRTVGSTSDFTELDNASEYTVYSHLASVGGGTTDYPKPVSPGNYYLPSSVPLGVSSRSMNNVGMNGRGQHLRGVGGTVQAEPIQNRLLMPSFMEVTSLVEMPRDYSTDV